MVSCTTEPPSVTFPMRVMIYPSISALYFSLGKTTFYMDGGDSAEFTVYKNIVTNRDEDDDDEIVEQPDWAFIITNRASEIKLWLNAREYSFCHRSLESSSLESWTYLTFAEGKELSTRLDNALHGNESFMDKKVESNVVLKPSNVITTYTCTKIVYSVRDDSR